MKPESVEKLKLDTPSNSSDVGKYLEKASQLATRFESNCTPKVSNVRRNNTCEPAIKFSCNQGHTFYKTFAHLDQIAFGAGRKVSITTAASSSDEEGSNSDSLPCRGCWCPKCEDFYFNLKRVASSSDCKLIGALYSSNLKLRCPKGKHLTTICYSRRLSDGFSCTMCKRAERDEAKRRMKEE